MKNCFALFICLLTFHGLIAQITFEPGYFIDNDDNKIECLIQNERWLFSPEIVSYRLNGSTDIRSFSVGDCKEFKIAGQGAYKRVSAGFPITQSTLKKKEKNPEPELVRKTVFVQNIIEGKASLYWYVGDIDIVYLFSKEDGPIEVLLYKKYVGDDLKVRENNIFKRQLLKDFPCDNRLDIQKVKYSRKSLIKYFEEINTCLGDNSFVVYERTAKQKANFPITLKVWGGVQQYGYEVGLTSRPGEVYEFENASGAKFGGEVEAFFPYFGYKKASVILSAQYGSFTSDYLVQPDDFIYNPSTEQILTGDFSILELMLGARYYFDITEKSNVFLEAGFVTNLYPNSVLNNRRTFLLIDRPTETSEVSTAQDNDSGASFGLGYSYNRRVYLRFNFITNQNIIVPGLSVINRDEVSRIALSLGYAFW